MNKSTTTAVTGVAMAALAGTAAYMLSHRKATPGKKLKQNTAKAIRTLGSVLDSVETMMRGRPPQKRPPPAPPS